MGLYSIKIKSSFKKVLYCIILLGFSLTSTAQKVKKTIIPKPYKSGTKEFVISYSIVVKGDKIDGIAETYNGGLKTAFVKGDVARLRLVSLMRTQSIFFNNKKGNSKKLATVLKESGKERTKMFLTDKQWKIFNAKNDSTRCEFFKEDTIRILNFLCTKAIITAKDSAKLEVYFYPSVKNKTLAAAEPLFNVIPGLVMKYTYTKEVKSIEYIATSLKTGTIAPKSFIIPSKDYLVQKYNPGKAGAIGDMNAEDEEGTEEEEMETPVAGATPAGATPPSTIDSTKTPTVPATTPKTPEVKPPTKN
jgi:hypothetical protein